MEALKSYLLTAMLAALISSLLSRLADTRFRGWIRYAAGLAILLMLTAPLISLADELTDSLSELDSYKEEQQPAAQEKVVGEIGKTMSVQIGDMVSQRFGLQRDRIRVKLTLDLADISAIEIYRVEISIRSDCDKDEIEQYISEALGCPVKVTVIKGEAE